MKPMHNRFQRQIRMAAFSILVAFGLQFSLSSALAASLEEGATAPSFEAPNQDGEVRKLSDHAGKWVLIYFYPKDDTPGCTRQACSLRDGFKQFKDAGVVIYGVSRQGAESHRQFRKKHRLPFDLLVDEEGSIGKAYGIGSMPLIGFYKRQSVLIDPKGKVAKFMDSVDPDTHAQDVLAWVRGALKKF